MKNGKNLGEYRKTTGILKGRGDQLIESVKVFTNKCLIGRKNTMGK